MEYRVWIETTPISEETWEVGIEKLLDLLAEDDRVAGPVGYGNGSTLGAVMSVDSDDIAVAWLQAYLAFSEAVAQVTTEPLQFDRIEVETARDADGPGFVGASDVAGILGVTRQRVYQLLKEDPSFPKPTGQLARGAVWDRRAIDAWMMARKQEEETVRIVQHYGAPMAVNLASSMFAVNRHITEEIAAMNSLYDKVVVPSAVGAVTAATKANEQIRAALSSPSFTKALADLDTAARAIRATVPFRFQFWVPSDVIIEEPLEEGTSAFEGKVVPNELLERLRKELAKDPRWKLGRVWSRRLESVPPRQELVVWLYLANDLGPADVRLDLESIIADVVVGAELVGVAQTGL